MIDSRYNQVRKENVAVVGLCCDFLSHHEQTIANVMGAVLKQLVGRGGIPDYLQEALRKAQKEFSGRGLAELMGMLKIAIAPLPQAFICLDALDECLSKHLLELLELLRDILWGLLGQEYSSLGGPVLGKIKDISSRRS